MEGDGFVIRMDATEAEIYGSHVLDLLRDAKQKLCDKYEMELETPVFIEIFPEQQDFAIRTFGLPGGEGFLGVCFGRVVTMNSPIGQGANLTNWKSVLWHEFCHVVTLQKTKNRMPRWLCEGISVYEERLANKAWGQSLNPRYREMILGGELTPVSELSSAFLRPKSAKHLDFAYYESSLVVEYLIEEYGLDSLKKILRDLGLGIPVNDAIRRHAAPTNVLNVQFDAFARKRAESLARDADWTKPELPANANSADWAEWNKSHPDNIVGMLGEARALVAEEKTEPAIALLKKMLSLYSDRDGAQDAYALLAKIYRDNERPTEELAALKKVAELDASAVDANSRLLELSADNESWDDVERYGINMLGINPMLRTPHRYLAKAAEQQNNDELLIPSLTALVKMEPMDPADIHYRLAAALLRQKDLARAKNHVLLALDQAPRYRDAHRLLLQIADAQKEADEVEEVENESTDDKPTSIKKP